MTGISDIKPQDFVNGIIEGKLDVSNKTTSTSRRFCWDGGSEDCSMKQVLNQFEKVADDQSINKGQLQKAWNKLIEADVKGSARYFEERGNSGMSLRQLNPAGMKKQAQFKRIASKIAAPEKGLSNDTLVRLSIRKVSKNRDAVILLEKFIELGEQQHWLSTSEVVGKLFRQQLGSEELLRDLQNSLNESGVVVGESVGKAAKAIARDQVCSNMLELGSSDEQIRTFQAVVGRFEQFVTENMDSESVTSYPATRVTGANSAGVKVAVKRQNTPDQYVVEIARDDEHSKRIDDRDLESLLNNFISYANLAYKGRFDINLANDIHLGSMEDQDAEAHTIFLAERVEPRQQKSSDAIIDQLSLDVHQLNVGLPKIQAMREIFPKLEEFIRNLEQVSPTILNQEVDLEGEGLHLNLSGYLNEAYGNISVSWLTRGDKKIDESQIEELFQGYLEERLGDKYYSMIELRDLEEVVEDKANIFQHIALYRLKLQIVITPVL